MVKLIVTDIDPDVIREFVEYSEESPSCLVWKVYRQKVKKG